MIALAQAGDPNLLLKAMRAGCSEFLYKPFNEMVFMDSLARVQEQLTTSGPRSTHSGAVLSFFGAKGGVGSTTLAVHLAMYLVECHQKKVLLIDNKPELGHVLCISASTVRAITSTKWCAV